MHNVTSIPFGILCIVAQLDANGACWLDRAGARGAECQEDPPFNIEGGGGGCVCKWYSMEAWDSFLDAQETAPACKVAA